MLIPFFTTPAPGRRDAPMVLSRSRWVIWDRGFSTLEGSAHAVRRVRKAAVSVDFLILI